MNRRHHSDVSTAKHPPRLRFHVVRRLRMLLLINALPLLVGLILFGMWFSGSVTFRRFNDNESAIINLMIAAAICCAAAGWFLIPLANWLIRYPAWHVVHTSRLLWALPALVGLLGGLALYAGVVIGCLFAVVAIAVG